jgi:predicted HicB family RNase H-like nuclease
MKMYKFEEYTLIVEESDKELYTTVPENRFVAHLKEIPEGSLYDYGATQEEAIKNLHVQFDTMQNEFHERLLVLPEPDKREKRDYSGRMVVRMPKWLHKQIVLLATEEQISINTFIINRLIKNTSEEKLFKTFCRLQQKLIDELPYKFNWSFTTFKQRQNLSSKIFNMETESPYKIEIQN